MEVKLIKIGRSNQNDIVIDDTSVSRFHLELFQDDHGQVFITDLKSTNGTTINGRRLIDSEILKPNDIVKLGSAPPILWQNYFREASNRVKTDASAPLELLVSSEKNWATWTIAGSTITLLVILGFIYKDSILGSSKAKDNQIVSIDENGKPRNEDGEVILHPDSDQKKKPVVPKIPIPQPNSQTITYDYGCMNQSLINGFGDLETEIVGGFGETVSLDEEKEVGKQLYDGCRDKYQFITDKRSRKLNAIKGKLESAIKNPRGFNYSIYLIRDNEINAFTAGGYIFVTTGMYNFVENDDELACVIGHEMAHNECKHINQHLTKQKVNHKVLGELFGSDADALIFFMTTPFNQKRETESDFHGIDYAVTAGYNSCKVINLWTRMASMETTGTKIDEMMRTHPYSSKRSTCCGKHIESNYDFKCP